MASEYLKWKYRDVKPEEKVPLTDRERRKNWWYYHKWHVVIGVVGVLILADLVCHALGVGQVKPDYRIAYVGASPLPEDTAAAVETAFASLGEDLNGDGKTVAQLVQYNSYPANGGADAQYWAANEVRLQGDLNTCESYFFLLEDPEWFQKSYHALSRLDGSLPEKDDDSVEDVCLAWSECPALASQELGEYSEQVMGWTAVGANQEVLAPLYVARRGFWTENSAEYPEGCAALWEKITEGAVS